MVGRGHALPIRLEADAVVRAAADPPSAGDRRVGQAVKQETVPVVGELDAQVLQAAAESIVARVLEYHLLLLQ